MLGRLPRAADVARSGPRRSGIDRSHRASDDPTVKTVASENTAAVVGIAIAYIGIGLHQLTGNAAFESAASFSIGALLTYVAFALAKGNKDLLIGEAAGPQMRRQLYDQLRSYSEIDEVVAHYTMRLGTRKLLVAARLDLAPVLPDFVDHGIYPNTYFPRPAG